MAGRENQEMTHLPESLALLSDLVPTDSPPGTATNEAVRPGEAAFP